MATSNAINANSTGLVRYNGTGTFDAVTTTNHDVLVGATGNGITNVGPGSAGQVLQSGGASADPAYSTATFPSTATGTGKILRADGTNWVATTATFPDTAGTSGNVLTSNGTNWTSATPAASGPFISLTGTLTNAQLKAINTSPTLILATPGAGKAVMIVMLTGKFNYGGNNAFTGGGNLNFFYGIGITNQASRLINATSGTTGTTSVIQNQGAGGPTIPFAITLVEDTAIYAGATANFTGNAANDNTVTWEMIYAVVTL